MARHSGQLYVIQFSTDLVNWVNAPVVELGASDEIIWGFTPAGRAFVRLKYSVASDFTIGYAGDADGDGMANGDEVCLFGTDPFTSDAGIDSDGDGIPNSDEFLAGLNPYLADSNGDGTLTINEDSDGDGIINLHELANSSFIYNGDTDGDLLPDGDDWLEMVDRETHIQQFEIPYDPQNPMAAYPGTAARASFRSQNRSAVPAFDGQYLGRAKVAQTNDGSLILAEHTYELRDLDTVWWQDASAMKTNYRLRTGHAAAGSASSPAANSEAQNVTVPVLIHRVSSVGVYGPVVEEAFEMQNLAITQGTVTLGSAIPTEPIDLAPYTDGAGEINLYQVVTATPLAVRFSVDTNMDGKIQSKRDGTYDYDDNDKGNSDNAIDLITGAPTINGQVPLLKSGDAGMILDINNNNSDAAVAASPFKEIHDHLSPDLDWTQDIAELTTSSKRPGHLSGQAELSVGVPLPGGLNSSNTSNRKYDLYLRRSGPACTRVHLVGGNQNQTVPFFGKRLLGLDGDVGTSNVADDRNEQLIFAEWFTGITASEGMLRLPVIIEGVRSGKEDLFLELREHVSGNVVTSEGVRIQVNVDQTPDPNLSLAKGKPLAGLNPHYFGINQVPSGLPIPGTIEAIRGHFTAEIPAGVDKGNWYPHMTWKNGNLRNGDMNPSNPATASFWLGLNTTFQTPSVTPPVQSSNMWVQFGLLLGQDPDDDWPNQSEGRELRMYLETGRKNGYLPRHNPAYLKASDTNGVFANWQTLGIDLDFVLFQDRDGTVSTDPDWHLVCKDRRGVNYFHIKRGRPSDDDPSNSAQHKTLDEIAHFSNYRQVEIKSELTNSVGFLFGHGGRIASPDKPEVPAVPPHPGSFANLQYATTRTNPSFPNFGTTSSVPKQYFDWAMGLGNNPANYNWTALTIASSSMSSSQTTGLLGPQNAVVLQPQVGTGGPLTGNGGFWKMQQADGGTAVQFLDSRMWGFAALRRH